jgi:DNA-directed RNA polymerase delta subunit
MKAEVRIYQDKIGFYAEIKIKHDFLDLDQAIESRYHNSKGQLKRKVSQFCADLNLECEFVSYNHTIVRLKHTGG